MDVEHSSTFPKSQQSTDSVRDGAGLVSSSALCLVKQWVAIWWTAKLGQITASEIGMKKQCR